MKDVKITENIEPSFDEDVVNKAYGVKKQLESYQRSKGITRLHERILMKF